MGLAPEQTLTHGICPPHSSSNAAGIFIAMNKPGATTTPRGGKGAKTAKSRGKGDKTSKIAKSANRKPPSKPKGKSGSVSRSSSMPLTFFIAVIIVILGSIQLLSTFHTYALNLAELNSLRNQEAALVAKKAELENDIKRWDDDAYVTAQARERLGFVFPGERSVRVLHPEAVTGGAATGGDKTSASTTEQTKPWYKDMFSSLSKADEGSSKNGSKNTSESQNTDSNGTNGTDSKNTSNNTKEGQ